VAIIGYGRVSTTDQNPQLQLDALRDAGAVRVFTDHGVSASTASRPELDACLDHLRAGDILIMAAFAQLERDTMIERTRAGLAAAAANGRKGGRHARWMTPMPPRRAACGTRASRPATSRRCWVSPAPPCIATSPTARHYELCCGAKGIRTPDLLDANETRYQLRHSPLR
jgi:DNA invertase Pin-like site-specific DNA recombinase